MECRAADAEQRLLGIGCSISIVAFFLALACYVRRPIMRGSESALLLVAQAMGQVFNVLSVMQYVSRIDPSIPCPEVVWLRQFGLTGSSLYYLALSVHLHRATCSPFANSGFWRFHVVAWVSTALVVVTVDTAEQAAATAGGWGSRGDGECPCLYPLFGAGFTAVMPIVVVMYALAFAFVVCAWRHTTRLVQCDGLFTEHRGVIAKNLLCILGFEAVYIAMILGAYALAWAHTAFFWILRGLLALQEALFSFAWILVYCVTAHAFERAVQNDVRADDFGIPELSKQLRHAIVRIIARGNRESVQTFKEARGPSAADTAASFNPSRGSEYERTLRIDVTEGRCPAEVHSHAPRVFHELRALFRIDPDKFVSSFEETHECFTEGKSGAFLYFTRDRRFIIKTATPSEFRFLRRMLPRYYDHVRKNPDTLLNRVLGAYQLRLYGQRVQVVVVESVFQTRRPIDERYDLKGSWVRSASRGDKLAQPSRLRRGGGTARVPAGSGGGVRTDVSMRGPLLLEPEDAQRLRHALLKDAEFLAARGIMDYSLLLGVSNTAFQICSSKDSAASKMDRNSDGTFARRPEPQHHHAHDLLGAEMTPCCSPRHGGGDDDVPLFRKQEGGLRAALVVGPEVYFAGIVDILQEFNWRKWVEYLARRFLLCGGRGVSCVPPEAYKRRFLKNVVEPLIQEGPLLRQRPPQRRSSSSYARPTQIHPLDIEADPQRREALVGKAPRHGAPPGGAQECARGAGKR